MTSTSRINFFIVGAAKSGTTTVFERLNSRSDVYLSPLKEPNFYSDDIDIKNFSAAFKSNTKLDLRDYFTKKPLPERQIGFVRNENEYSLLFEPAPSDAKIIGECSTSYLWSKAAPNNIYQAHPKAKILILLRDPISRLYSHYMMARKYGFTSKLLIDAVKEDMKHPQKGWGSSELFFELGLYSDQIARYKTLFPQDQIKIILTSNLRDKKKWEELISWLGLKIEEEVSDKSGDANKAGLPRFESINRFLTKIGLKKSIGALLSKSSKKSITKWYYKSEDLPKITEEESFFLREIYKEELVRLKSEHGISF